jgi:predicted kinase
VDATNLTRAQRQRFQDVAAQAGGRYQVVHFTAPDAVLLERIASRARAASDASEADAAVLAAQRRDFEPFASDEPVLTLDTQSLDLQTILRALERA